MSERSTPSILVLDLGTSRLKAALFSPDGREHAHAAAPYPTYTPAPGHAEQRPQDWWQAACQAVGQLWEGGADPRSVEMISVTGQMHGLVPVDRANVPLAPCLTLRDRRAEEQVVAIRNSMGAERYYAITGERLDASLPFAKMMWFRQYAGFWPQLAHLLSPKDWLRQQLTGGDPVTDPIEAAGVGLYDVMRGGWSGDVAAACDIPLDQLPTLREATARAGTLQPRPAADLRLRPGTPVAVGAADDVEFIGAGLLHPGQCVEHLGSTGSLLMVVDRPADDPTGTLELYPHLLPGRWIVGGSTSNGGAALEWLRSALGQTAALQLPNGLNLNADTSQENIAPPIFLPYLSGERSPVWQPEARGLFWGLSLEHGQAHLVRAVFEGVAFSLRHLLDALETICGGALGEIRVGSSADRDWLQLRADVYGRPLRLLQVADPTALGAALVGACALGAYPDLTAAVESAVQVGETLLPQPAAALAARYQTYRALSAWVGANPLSG